MKEHDQGVSRIDVLWRGPKNLPPRPIKLQIPGWSGHDLDHGDGAAPQPWHCPPFVDASTYGLELAFPFDAECSVSVRDGELHVDRKDFSAETHPTMQDPPFKQFAPNHYGLTSALDLLVPDDMIVRVEPHPRFYTDTTGTCPCAVPGHIHTAFWPRVFFVVFKAPAPGETHVFRKGEPYAQILLLPRKTLYEVKPMPEELARERERMSGYIQECAEEIAKHTWTDDTGQIFDDKYKVLQSTFLKRGHEGVKEVLKQAIKAWLPKQSGSRSEGKIAG